MRSAGFLNKTFTTLTMTELLVYTRSNLVKTNKINVLTKEYSVLIKVMMKIIIAYQEDPETTRSIENIVSLNKPETRLTKTNQT